MYSLFLISSWVLILNAAAAQQPMSLYDEALGQLRQGNFAEGCGNAEMAVQQEPRRFEAYNLLGVCSVKRGDIAKAETYFRKSLEINPHYSEARINLALNLRQRGKEQDAIAQLEEVLRSDPNNAAALFQLGKGEAQAGAHAKAIVHLQRARQLSPHNMDFNLTLASEYLAAGQRDAASKLIESILPEKHTSEDLISTAVIAFHAGQDPLARQALEQAIRQDPNSLEKILTVARKLSGDGDYKTVRAVLETAQGSGESSSEWNALLGFADYKLGDPPNALAHLRRAVELSPQTEDYYLKMGQLLLFYNSDEAAVTLFKKGLLNVPDSSDLHFGLAVCYWAHQIDTQGAIDQLNAALEIEPDFQSALELISLIYLYEKKWDLLQNAGDRLMRANPRSPRGYYFKATALMETGRKEGEQSAATRKAYDLLEQSVRLDPRFSYSRVALGQLLMEQGRLPRAIAEFQQAIKLAPDDAEGYYHLAIAYRQAGEKAKSEAAFNEFNQRKERDKGSERREGLFQIVK